MNLSAQRLKKTRPMNDGAKTPDVRNALDAPRGVAQGGEQQPTVSRSTDNDIVLFDTRGRQINPLPTRMTVAEALEDSLGPRR
jgi:hypothetical protein